MKSVFSNITSNRVYLLFTLLYFAQGAIVSYQTIFFKPHLNAEGIPTAQIAVISSLVLLPFVIKVVFGLLSDRINLFGLGHRVPYIISGVVICMVAFLFAFFIAPANNFSLFAAAILLAAFAMALFDTATDAYAVEIVEPAEYTSVQSYMTIGRAIGYTLLSVLFGLTAKFFGYSSIFIIICACLLVPLALARKMPEHAVQTKRKAFEWKAFAVLLKVRNMLFCVLLVLSWFLFQGIDGTVTFYLSKSLLASKTTIGYYGTLKGIGMVAGAVLVLIVSKRHGLLMAVMCTLALVSISGLAASSITNLSYVPLLAVLLGVTAGFHWTVWMSVIMNIVDLRIAGSTIAVFQIMANIGFAAGEGIATNLTASIGFSNVFLYFAVANLLLMVPTVLHLRRIPGVQKTQR